MTNLNILKEEYNPKQPPIKNNRKVNNSTGLFSFNNQKNKLLLFGIINNKTIVKGLFGPKPQVWTLFMFFHFAVAVAFIGFSVMAYVQWSLKTTNTFALIMVFALPALWILIYFLGRLGKSTGHKQMDELYRFMMKTLEK